MTVLDQLREEETLPRRNGELVFDEPWESRAFSVAVALVEEGRYEWQDFRSRLIAEIGAWDDSREWRYYDHWLSALERLLVECGLASLEELDQRSIEIAHAIAHEHDHEHGHHDHEGGHHA